MREGGDRQKETQRLRQTWTAIEIQRQRKVRPTRNDNSVQKVRKRGQVNKCTNHHAAQTRHVRSGGHESQTKLAHSLTPKQYHTEEARNAVHQARTRSLIYQTHASLRPRRIRRKNKNIKAEQFTEKADITKRQNSWQQVKRAAKL